VPTRQSAGILLYRGVDGRQPGEPGAIEVLLVHIGGPFFAHRHEGAWTIPKGELDLGESPLEAAVREFAEETGQPPPAGNAIDLGSIRQTGGKVVHAFALAGDFDVATLDCNLVKMEWPRGSGRVIEFPECDRAEWFDPAMARAVVVKGQAELLDRLEVRLS
jgi:predicted NUDIX family NTP pyrophosphohydrolase